MLSSGMTAYSKLQDAEFAAETDGYTAHRHQREVGAGWFDAISVAVKGGASATTALTDSTEEDQFTVIKWLPAKRWLPQILNST